ncbi:MFS transporter [uncultured Aquimarina sp.]|uniref:MFS transporter n=1 Tax=uncultured Aquimarina sp. TaxID=575652 RepID=UPI00261EA2C4|nr:MFS transporter [uncultured Aquimarina sp.]
MNKKPTLTFGQIWNMCFGFLGVQFGMGLTLANMSPIYRYLGADEASLPILWLAGPITGLVIQPIIGAMGDNTWGKWGRRRPYYTIGAIIASICLIAMPHSSTVWVAAGLLWFLDGAVNTSMESFRAMVGDMVPKKQQSITFSVQTFMIGVGQLFSAVMPYLLTLIGVAIMAESNTVPDFVKYAFMAGAFIILSSILWTGYTTKEYPPEDMEAFKKRKTERGGLLNTFKEIFQAVKEMPLVLRQIWWVKLTIWYGFPLMWQYMSLSFARHVYDAPNPEVEGFSDGVAMGGVGMAIYCSAPIFMSFIFNRLISKYGTRKLWALFQVIGGFGFIAFQFTNSLPWLFVFCFLIGIGFSGVCTLPYLMLTRTVPKERVGVYMGLLNAFICIPQIISMLTIPLYYEPGLGGDPRNALLLAGILWIIAAPLALRISKTVDTLG